MFALVSVGTLLATTATLAVVQVAANNVCVDKGCPGPQTADSKTFYEEPCYSGQTNRPPVPGAVPNYGPGGQLTWEASEPTTLYFPSPTPAGLGVPGTSYFVATSTVSLNCLRFEKPYVTSSVIPGITCPNPDPVTITETSYQQLPPLTVTETSTSTTTLLQPTTEFVVNTVTQTETQVVTTTTSVLHCPTGSTGSGGGAVGGDQGQGNQGGGGQDNKPPVCLQREFQAWKSITLTQAADGSIPPYSTTVDLPAAAIITLVDGDFKSEKYSVLVDGQTIGSTSDVPSDTKKYCKNGNDCLINGFSSGQFKVGAGSHTISVVGSDVDRGSAYWRAYLKINEDCAAVSSGGQGGNQGTTGSGNNAGGQVPPNQDSGSGGSGGGQDTQVPPPTTPPPECQHRTFKDWNKFTITQQSSGSPAPFTTTIDVPAAALLTVADGDFKAEKYSIAVNGHPVGTTSDFVTDPKKYCKNGNDCLLNGFSNGQFKVAAGTHTVTITTVDYDHGLSYFTGYYKLEEDCSVISGGGPSQQQPISVPKPACQNRAFKPWTTASLSKSASGAVNAYTTTLDLPADAYLTVVDGDFKSEQYTVLVDGSFVGTTAVVAKDKKKYCKKPDDCITNGFSSGRFVVPAGQHTISINGADYDAGYSYFTVYFKADEKCD